MKTRQEYHLERLEHNRSKMREYYLRNRKECLSKMHDYYIKNKESILAVNAEWRKNHPEKMQEYRIRYIQKNSASILFRRKRKARELARTHNKNKRPCLECGSDKSVQKHHPDYCKPRKIIWLCIKCHRREHIKKKGVML